MAKVERTFEAPLNGGRFPLAGWVLVVSVAQWALDTAYGECYQACPYQLIFGREPAMPFATEAIKGDYDLTVERLNA